MTDLAMAHALVVRLRSGDPRANFWKICADTIEAQASEIERLRSCEEAMHEGSEIIIELKQEIERLRAALEELVETAYRDMKTNQDDEQPGHWSTRTDQAILNARAALFKHMRPVR